MTLTKEQQEAEQAEARAKAAPEGTQIEQAAEQDRSPLLRPEDLVDALTIEGSARAQELRVDECTASTEQGESNVRRVGLPPTGAEPRVTYRNVQVSIEVKGGPPRTHSG